MKTYILLDGGATKPIISKKAAKEIGVTTVKKNADINTVLETAYGPREFTSDIAVGNLQGDLVLHLPETMVLDFTTTENDKPPRNKDIKEHEYMKGVEFEELEHDEISMILSAEYAWTWLLGERKRSTIDKPLAIETRFGWALIGGKGKEDENPTCWRTSIKTDNDEIHELFEKLFKHEFADIPINKKHESLEDIHAMKQLEETIKFDEEIGHYRVGLPWKKSRQEAAKILNPIETKQPSLNRLKKSMAKVRKNEQHFKYVQAQMQTQFDDGHVTIVKDEKVGENIPTWVLPLHIVFHPNKPTKPRICHDAKSKTGNTCLNDQLLAGSDLLNKLTGVLFRFRLGKVTVSADIKGFFHQVYVDKDDMHVFRFWWFADKECTIPCLCELRVHIFGAKSSPTVCTFVLRHLGKAYRKDISEETFWAIIRSFYVDDFLGSFDDVETARKVRIELQETLLKGGFELLKWKSSHKGVVDNEDEETEIEIKEQEEVTSVDKVLGVKYSFSRDEFFFHVNPEKVTKEIRTKRDLLKTLAACYDPLGLV